MPAAFVTGGTGFVGLNLIEQLLAESWEVIALHRPTSNLRHLRGKDIQLVEGSITEPKSLITKVGVRANVNEKASNLPEGIRDDDVMNFQTICENRLTSIGLKWDSCLVENLPTRIRQGPYSIKT